MVADRTIPSLHNRIGDFFRLCSSSLFPMERAVLPAGGGEGVDVRQRHFRLQDVGRREDQPAVSPIAVTAVRSVSNPSANQSVFKTYENLIRLTDDTGPEAPLPGVPSAAAETRRVSRVSTSRTKMSPQRLPSRATRSSA